MSLEEIARATYEAFNRRDYDAILEVSHPDAELQRPSGLDIVRGQDGLTIRDGMMSRFEIYFDRAEALAAFNRDERP